MSKQMDWRRAKLPRSLSQIEHKFGSDVELPSGCRTYVVPKDGLSKRADRAMESWLKSLTPAQRRKLESP